jgi:hypothetical protein
MGYVTRCHHSGACVQYDDLCKLLPKLQPRILPRHLRDFDFQALLQRSPDAAAGFESTVDELSRARSSRTCHACGARGTAQHPAPAEADRGRAHEDGRADAVGSKRAAAAAALTSQSKLHFTTVWGLNFGDRTAELRSARFCCEKCRACFDVGSILQLAATRCGGSAGSEGCASTLCRVPRRQSGHGTALPAATTLSLGVSRSMQASCKSLASVPVVLP